MASTEALIGYILSQLDEMGVSVVKTALVKLLYLCDVEGLRMGLGRVSHVNWSFYKYGPYASEIDAELRRMVGSDLDEHAGVSARGRSYTRYKVHDPARWESELKPWEKGVVRRVLERWAGESLEKLLNYVYFETEPMLDAEWNKPLRMGLVRAREETRTVSIPDDAAAAILEAAERLKAKRREEERMRTAPDPPPRYDDLYYEALEEAERD